ncbi:hypothetical protein dlv622_00023 [Klebsiella phage vB_KpnP_Dlv622]|uniref:Uncharacterized protein n=3 Tax=Drulisvirus TaxID=1920774 RepID=A0A1U8V4F2_9CAUD|nr:hypothetical protein HOQ99_gp23 [Klebsiella phage phiBO1E]AIT13592.1 hypothetical protein BO1E_0023 [Klebsiella phage phiBO1E]QOI68541.1 hypothetical protein dlv622_00023 [Klebsiella phage vB_KpnP_Dlv622]QWT56611.1 hypothetical protein Kp_Pokalde_001_020 [Klebsiella phage Kp_Pokalde_001]
MTIKPGSIVEMLELGPEPIDPRHRAYFAPGTQHRVISYDVEFGEVELLNPDSNSEKPGDGITFFAGEYKLIAE